MLSLQLVWLDTGGLRQPQAGNKQDKKVIEMRYEFMRNDVNAECGYRSIQYPTLILAPNQSQR